MKRINYLTIISLILLPCIILSFTARNNNAQEERNPVPTAHEKQSPTPKVDVNSIIFNLTTLENIWSDCCENELRANAKYVDKYFSITAKFSSADSDTSFCLYLHTGNQFLHLGNLWCYCDIEEDILDSNTVNNLKEKLYLLNNGDFVTVKGKITSISLDRTYLDVYEIEI